MSFNLAPKKLAGLATEAKEKWGDTPAFQEFAQKAMGGKMDPAEMAKSMGGIFTEFGALKTKNPADPAVQGLVKKLQDTITANFFNCSTSILSSLGQMYTGDKRFADNIDSMGGKGTADFAAKAIEIFCKK